MVKQAGGPTVREKGTGRRARVCREGERERGREWKLWSTDKEYVWMHEWECLCACLSVRLCVWERENERMVKSTWSSQGDLLLPTKICLQWAPNDPPEDAALTANTHTSTHPHGHTSSQAHVSADIDTWCLRSPVRNIRTTRFQSMALYRSTRNPGLKVGARCVTAEKEQEMYRTSSWRWWTHKRFCN